MAKTAQAPKDAPPRSATMRSSTAPELMRSVARMAAAGARGDVGEPSSAPIRKRVSSSADAAETAISDRKPTSSVPAAWEESVDIARASL